MPQAACISNTESFFNPSAIELSIPVRKALKKVAQKDNQSVAFLIEKIATEFLSEKKPDEKFETRHEQNKTLNLDFQSTKKENLYNKEFAKFNIFKEKENIETFKSNCLYMAGNIIIIAETLQNLSTNASSFKEHADFSSICHILMDLIIYRMTELQKASDDI